MKSILYCTFFFIAFSGLSQEDEEERIVEMAIEELIDKRDPILGLWHVDTIYFFNNGIRNEGSTPLVLTKWKFLKEGSLVIENTMRMSCTYITEDAKLTIDMYGTPMEYTIIELSNKTMRLWSESTRSETVFWRY